VTIDCWEIQRGPAPTFRSAGRRLLHRLIGRRAHHPSPHHIIGGSPYQPMAETVCKQRSGWWKAAAVGTGIAGIGAGGAWYGLPPISEIPIGEVPELVGGFSSGFGGLPPVLVLPRPSGPEFPIPPATFLPPTEVPTGEVPPIVGSFPPLAPPIVTPGVPPASEVPEPGSGWLLIAAFLPLAFVLRGSR
jgi:hypothetical protein